MSENSPRSAHATIRGYLYQTCLGVLRWLDLKANEVLVCEGDEDLDRHLLDGTVVSEQVKAYSGRLGLGDQAVLESLTNFLRTYVALRREDQDRQFIFTTMAEPRQQRKTGLDFDLLEKWKDRVHTPEVVEAVRSLLEPEESTNYRDKILDVRTWLDSQPEGWLGFISAVEWTFKAPDLDDIRRTIQSRLAQGEKTRNLDAYLFTDRLVVHVLEASSQPDINARTLTPAALSKLAEEDLNRWATSPHARRIREAFNEAARIQDLLNTGTDKLRDLKPGTLLTAAHEVIPFDEAGRQKELDLLAAWCQEAELRSGLLLTGEGGSGKTRLMIEWCRRLRHQGWYAGFLRRDRQAIELDPFLKGTAPRLVVVDYAETQMAVVKPLLQKLASAEFGVGPKVRVVLLARRKGDWWRNLSEEDGEVARLPKQAEAISPLISSNVEERREVFHRAMEGFAAQTGHAVPLAPPLPDLSHKDFERVLLLHMAALAALEGTRVGNAAEGIRTTLVHERRLWRKQVADLALPRDLSVLLEKALETAVAAITLVQGMPKEQDAQVFLMRCLRSLPLEKRHTFYVIRLLRDLYGFSSEEDLYIAPLHPALLGEELIETTLNKDPDLLNRIGENCSPREAYFTVAVLSRLVQRVSTAEEWILAFSRELEEKGTNETWLHLQQLCDDEEYQRSVPLRELAHIATAERLKFLRARYGNLEMETSEHDPLFADRAITPDQRKEVLKAAEAVRIYREHAQLRPNDFLPDLATKLNHLANKFQEIGRQEAALQATHDAIAIYQDLAKQYPDEFQPELAMSFNYLGDRLNMLGRQEEALTAYHKALLILSPYFLRFPTAFAPWMATMVKNYCEHAHILRQDIDETLLAPITEAFRSL